MDLTDEATQRTRLRLGILGPLSASLDGVEVGLGGRRQQAVVAVLLVAHGQQVSAERLLDTLWDGTPPPSGAASLQSYVSHVRRALEPDRAPRTPSQVLVSRGSGYALVVEDDDVDANAGQGRADTEARRLGELRDVAREQLLTARLDTGEAAVVVPEAERLADELGVDPGPALRALEAEVLAQSPSLDAPVSEPLPVAAPVPDPGPVRLPSQRSPSPRPELAVDVKASFPEQSWQRLKGIRSAVDPAGLVKANHPVPRLYENGLPTK